MKVLITGAAGRLGSQLAKLFSKNGFNVNAFDLPLVNMEHIEKIPRVKLFLGDITDSHAISKACSDVDVIIHLAAILPPNSESNRNSTLKVNVDGTNNLIECSRSNTVIIFASSISTYGITSDESSPINENHPLHSHNNYSESKINAERYIKDSGLPYIILRVAPIALADLIELPDVMPFRADQRVEFIYIEDAVYAFYQASLKPKAIGLIMNISGGVTWQMLGSEYIEGFYESFGIEVEPTYNENYTAIDWYDSSRSKFLGYQRASFYDFQDKLKNVALELGLI